MLFISLLANLSVVNKSVSHFFSQFTSCTYTFHQIDWDRRFENAPTGTKTFVSLDGTDFRIMEPTVFDPKWYAHKFNGPGLRYEIGLSIFTGHILWAHGGLPCGEWPDIRLARDAFVDHLQRGENVLADKGYRDQNFFENPNGEQGKKGS